MAPGRRSRKSHAVDSVTILVWDSTSRENSTDHTLEDLHMTPRLYLSALALGLTLAAVGCGKDNPATPTPAADPKFTATLLPANETTAVVGGDVSGSGTVTITMHPTKDAAGNVTAATADFTSTLAGFPGV